MEPLPENGKKINEKTKERACTQNGNHRNSKDAEQNIKEFRRACPQFIAVGVKNTVLFVCGIAMGFPTIVIPALQESNDNNEPSDLILNKDQVSWFSSVKLICILFGNLFSGAFTRPIGKRRAMQLINVPIIGSWIFFHFATCREHLYAALCLAGFASGLLEAPVLTYVAEITEPKYRGILSVMGAAGFISGVLVEFILGAFLHWRTIAAVNTVFPVISIVALFFIPESPTWLIRNQKFDKAIQALQWLRGWVPQNKIQDEYNALYELLITKPALDKANSEITEKNKKSCYNRTKMYRNQAFWVPFILIGFTFFVGHFSGKTPLQTYAVQIFHTLEVPINKFHATILLGVAEMISTILSAFLIHFTGKRPLVLTSTIGCGLCFFGTATYSYVLNVIPAFAIDVAVVNASVPVLKDLLVTGGNKTNIFETQYNPILGKPPDMMGIFGYDITTLSPELFETTNSPLKTFVQEQSNDRFYPGSDKFTPFDKYSISVHFNETTDISHQKINLQKPKEMERSNTMKIDLPIMNHVASDNLIPISEQHKNNLAWLPLIMLIGAAFFAHLGLRIIPWILIGEVFPASIRNTASGFAGAVGLIFGFSVNKLFIQMLATLSLSGTFWFYSSVSISGAVVMYFVLPETENKSLAEIESYFAKKR